MSALMLSACDQILSLKEVQRRTFLTRRKINKLEKSGMFTRRVQIGPNSVGWSERGVQEWIAREEFHRSTLRGMARLQNQMELIDANRAHFRHEGLQKILDGDEIKKDVISAQLFFKAAKVRRDRYATARGQNFIVTKRPAEFFGNRTAVYSGWNLLEAVFVFGLCNRGVPLKDAASIYKECRKHQDVQNLNPPFVVTLGRTDLKSGWRLMWCGVARTKEERAMLYELSSANSDYVIVFNLAAVWASAIIAAFSTAAPAPSTSSA